MASAGVISFELVVDLSRCSELLLKAVSTYKGRRSVHLVEIPDLIGNIDKGSGLVKLLLYQFVTEDRGELLGGEGLAGSRIEKGSGLVLHISSEVVPCLGHFILCKINLVRDIVFSHFISPFIFPGTNKKYLSHSKFTAGTGSNVYLRCHPAWCDITPT